MFEKGKIKPEVKKINKVNKVNIEKRAGRPTGFLQEKVEICVGRRRKPIKGYHNESDIFHVSEPKSLNNTVSKKHFKDDTTDIFHLKEEKLVLEKKPKKNLNFYKESFNDPPQPTSSKKISLAHLKETEESAPRGKQILPEKRKEDKNNTLAYDLSTLPPSVEKSSKKMIKDPNKPVRETYGKKIYPDKIKEDPGNTLAFH